ARVARHRGDFESAASELAPIAEHQPTGADRLGAAEAEADRAVDLLALGRSADAVASARAAVEHALACGADAPAHLAHAVLARLAPEARDAHLAARASSSPRATWLQRVVAACVLR